MRLPLVLAALAATAAAKSVVSPDGRTVTLTNAKGVTATLARGGASLQRYSIPDRDGVLGDVVLGLDDAAAYEVRKRGATKLGKKARQLPLAGRGRRRRPRPPARAGANSISSLHHAFHRRRAAIRR